MKSEISRFDCIYIYIYIHIYVNSNLLPIVTGIGVTRCYVITIVQQVVDVGVVTFRDLLVFPQTRLVDEMVVGQRQLFVLARTDITVERGFN